MLKTTIKISNWDSETYERLEKRHNTYQGMSCLVCCVWYWILICFIPNNLTCVIFEWLIQQIINKIFPPQPLSKNNNHKTTTKNQQTKKQQASGVAVAQECKNQFDEIKKGKKHRYVIFYIEDEKMIKVEAVGDRDASYDSFFMDLTKVNK